MAHHKNIEKKSIRSEGADLRRPRPKKDEQEFGLAPKEFIICSECNSVFFDKSWHHRLDDDIEHLNPDKKVEFKTCPACQMKKDKVFEGQLVIILEENPGAAEEIMRVVKNSEEQAKEKDPMDRILWTEKQGKEIRIFTSENQLAVRMAKKLDSAFKGGKIDI
ncbi:MAG: hypothetical protein WD898_01680, partial [Candidatus Paceibacterota bacterium]